MTEREVWRGDPSSRQRDSMAPAASAKAAGPCWYASTRAGPHKPAAVAALPRPLPLSAPLPIKQRSEPSHSNYLKKTCWVMEKEKEKKARKKEQQLKQKRIGLLALGDATDCNALQAMTGSVTLAAPMQPPCAALWRCFIVALSGPHQSGPARPGKPS